MARRPKRYGGGERERRETLRGPRHGGHGAHRRASEADAWERDQDLEPEDIDLDLEHDLEPDSPRDLSGLDRVDQERLSRNAR